MYTNKSSNRPALWPLASWGTYRLNPITFTFGLTAHGADWTLPADPSSKNRLVRYSAVKYGQIHFFTQYAHFYAPTTTYTLPDTNQTYLIRIDSAYKIRDVWATGLIPYLTELRST